MNKNLYFIRIIADALKAPDPGPEIRKAFDEIEKLGRQPEYRQGYLQFLKFMDKVRESGKRDLVDSGDFNQAMIRDFVFQLATGLLDRDSIEGKQLLALIRSRPEWQKEFEELSAQASDSEGLSGQMKIIVTKNGETIGSIPAKPSPFAQNIVNVTPGFYEVRLNTGRLIWQGELAASDLIWAAAFPEQKLDMAADTDDFQQKPTREYRLLDGELTIRVFPAIESGRIEFKIKETRS